jgi:AraC family transcriptional regulator of adaptative response/methylated-DNA-[protein]-cysteine methyltransferase
MIKPMELPKEDTMYHALVNKDSTFEGIFIAGIKTTGIFCRPTCTARKPKRRNVEYFPTPREALQAGYRPCKVCRPMEKPGVDPDWLRALLKEMHDDPGAPWKDADLRERGLDPNRVRRWFKKRHDMTFHAYLRSLRINRAFGTIRKGDKVIEAAFKNGYDSLSGFTGSFKQNTGFAPSESTHQQLVQITRLTTPLGLMLAGATSEGICLLEFTDRRMLETQLKNLRKRLDAELLPGDNPHFAPLQQQLDEYFEGKRRRFDLPLVLPGTDFQRQVWSALQDIPYGQTRSYQEQAAAIGLPKAVRAVARANGDNRIAIIIPCHRVIGSDGKLTGYGGGLWRKRFLLELEGTGG